MNKWEGILSIIVVLIVGFLAVAFLQPSFLQLFTTYIVEVVVAIFGVAVVVVVLNFGAGQPRRKRY